MIGNKNGKKLSTDIASITFWLCEVIKRKKNCFYVVFDDDPKHEFCISYSDTLIEDEIFSNKDLKDLRLKENE
jgi:hypothetical protein